MTSERTSYQLADIIYLIGGGTPKTSVAEYWNGDIPWLSVKDFNNDDRYVYSTEKSITEAGLNNSSTKMLAHDDIIISARGTVGELAMIPFPMAFNQSCYGIRGKNDVIVQPYLYYLLKDSIRLLKSQTHGSVFDTITRDTFVNIEVSLPPLAEQQMIADTLTVLDDKITNNTKINNHLEQMAQAIFKSWFVDFELFGGEMPGDWREGSIYVLMDVIYGAPFKSSLFNSEKNGYPLIRIRDLKTFAPQLFTPETLPKMEKVHEGDVLVGMDAEFRPCIWQGETGVLNQRVCKIVPKEGISRIYVYAALKPHLEFIEFHKTGTTVSHIGKSDFDRIQITIPSSAVLKEFSELVEPLYLQILNNSRENLRLSETRDTLLPRLMSGELSIANLGDAK